MTPWHYGKSKQGLVVALRGQLMRWCCKAFNIRHMMSKHGINQTNLYNDETSDIQWCNKT